MLGCQLLIGKHKARYGSVRVKFVALPDKKKVITMGNEIDINLILLDVQAFSLRPYLYSLFYHAVCLFEGECGIRNSRAT